MLQMGYGIADGSLVAGAQEAVVEGGMRHAPFLGECPQLVVGKVARHVAERLAVAVAAHDRLQADVECIVERLLTAVAEVNHDAQAVHLADDLFAEGAHSAMGVLASCRVADEVITVVAEGDVGYAPVLEVGEQRQVVFYRQSVLYAQDNRLLARLLVGIEVIGCACQGEIVTVLLDDRRYLVEDGIGIRVRSGEWGVGSWERNLIAESLSRLGLWQIGHHEDGIQTTFRHLVQVYEDAWVALMEVDALRKEHRGVDMCVDGENLLVQLSGTTVDISLLNQPAEQGLPVAAQPFGMPLYTHDGFFFTAFHRFDDAVGSRCRYAEPLTW